MRYRDRRTRVKPTLIRYLEAALLARAPSLAQRVALAVARIARPGTLDTREEWRRHFRDRLRVSVRAWGDDDPDHYRRLRSGDTWMRHGLIVELGRAGCAVTDVDPDVVVHLHGREVELPRRAVKVLWVHSHPETLTPAYLARYDHVFCASALLCERLASGGVPAKTLLPATALRPRGPAPLRHEVVFVGNARVDGGRAILDALGDEAGFAVEVWGGGHRRLPAAATWRGEWVEYLELPALYGSSAISLNDHLPSMAEAGIVAPRVYDILAGGGFCISDHNPGLRSAFGDAVPQYRSAGELRELIRHYLDRPDERQALMAEGRAVAMAATWEDRARALLAPTGRAPDPGAIQRPR
jgi:hypothetical protein